MSEAAAIESERGWRDEVRGAATPDLASETDLLRVLLFAKRQASAGEPAVTVSHAPEVTLGLLRAALAEAIIHGVGSRAFRSSPRLEWASLVEVYGGEEILEKRIQDLLAQRPAGADDLLELAEKYVDGWRPKNFGD